jgi:hypothetical protein
MDAFRNELEFFQCLLCERGISGVPVTGFPRSARMGLQQVSTNSFAVPIANAGSDSMDCVDLRRLAIRPVPYFAPSHPSFPSVLPSRPSAFRPVPYYPRFRPVSYCPFSQSFLKSSSYSDFLEAGQIKVSSIRMEKLVFESAPDRRLRLECLPGRGSKSPSCRASPAEVSPRSRPFANAHEGRSPVPGLAG